MKIILSRKGFDSGYGGMPSPILPDRTMLSMPIPNEGDKVQYCNIQHNGQTYSEILAQLKPNNNVCNGECHLDPDIRENIIARDANWMPAFGQIGAAQSHLRNQGVGMGDIFLFFGWFRHTELVDNRLSYIGPSSGFHAIYGYLQVGNIINNKCDVPAWLESHPHACDKRWCKNNAIYIATEKLSIAPTLSGAGCFNYSNSLKLTKDGCSRSIWALPDFFKDIPISYNKKSWKEDGFHSAAKGQEFVFEANDNVLNWLNEIFRNTSL